VKVPISSAARTVHHYMACKGTTVRHAFCFPSRKQQTKVCTRWKIHFYICLTYACMRWGGGGGVLFCHFSLGSPVVNLYTTRLNIQTLYRRPICTQCIFGAFAKFRKATIASSCPSVCVRPHRTTRLQLDGFGWNLIFEIFSKTCRENSNFIKIRQE
jgi:hypothetical protein